MRSGWVELYSWGCAREPVEISSVIANKILFIFNYRLLISF